MSACFDVILYAFNIVSFLVAIVDNNMLLAMLLLSIRPGSARFNGRTHNPLVGSLLPRQTTFRLK